MRGFCVLMNDAGCVSDERVVLCVPVDYAYFVVVFSDSIFVAQNLGADSRFQIFKFALPPKSSNSTLMTRLTRMEFSGMEFARVGGVRWYHG